MARHAHSKRCITGNEVLCYETEYDPGHSNGLNIKNAGRPYFTYELRQCGGLNRKVYRESNDQNSEECRKAVFIQI